LVYCEPASCARARAGVRVTSATVARRMEGITAEPQAHAGILREIMASLASGQLPCRRNQAAWSSRNTRRPG